MTIKSIIAAALVFACASAFTYRDTIAQGLCNGFPGCYENVTIPCPAGSGGVENCVGITANPDNVPGGTKQCSSGTAPTYYASGPAPQSWVGCVSMDGQTINCPRIQKSCMIVYFFASKNDCTGGGTVCANNTVYQCAYGVTSVNDQPAPGGVACGTLAD